MVPARNPIRRVAIERTGIREPLTVNADTVEAGVIASPFRIERIERGSDKCEGGPDPTAVVRGRFWLFGRYRLAVVFDLCPVT